MKAASRKYSTFAPDRCVRGIGSIADCGRAGMWNPLLAAPVQAGGEGILTTL